MFLLRSLHAPRARTNKNPPPPKKCRGTVLCRNKYAGVGADPNMRESVRAECGETFAAAVRDVRPTDQPAAAVCGLLLYLTYVDT